jgi:hypothetical protein
MTAGQHTIWDEFEAELERVADDLIRLRSRVSSMRRMLGEVREHVPNNSDAARRLRAEGARLEKERIAFYLRSIGWSTRRVGKVLGCTPAHAQRIMEAALRRERLHHCIMTGRPYEEERKHAVLAIRRGNWSIDLLRLSVRSYNALQSADVSTVLELAAMTSGELLKLSSFGRKSLREVQEILTELGLHLGMSTGDLDRYVALYSDEDS